MPAPAPAQPLLLSGALLSIGSEHFVQRNNNNEWCNSDKRSNLDVWWDLDERFDLKDWCGLAERCDLDERSKTKSRRFF